MPRNNALDLAKSWAIISVLIYHVVKTFVHCEYVGSLVDTYFLTLFFFISGLLVKDKKIVSGWCKKQVIHLLVPFLSCWLLYRLFLLGIHGSPIFWKGAIDDAKGGYWFILVLFMFNIMLYGLRMLMVRLSSRYLKLLMLTLPFVLSAILCMLLPYDVAGFFSLMSVRRYWLFFVYGYAITNIWQCGEILNDKRFGFLTCCAYCPMAIYYATYIVDVNTNFDFAFWIVTNVLAIHCWLFVFYRLQHLLSNKLILNIGMNTLGIYVFHYYPLHLLNMVIGEGKYTFANTGWSLIFIVLFYTLVLLVVAYLTTLVVKKNKLSSELLLGIKISTI